MMKYEKEVLQGVQFPTAKSLKKQYTFFKVSVTDLLSRSIKDYLGESGRIKQLEVYGDLIREAAKSGTTFPSVLMLLQRAITRVGVEGITESMGSLLKKQY